MIMLNIKKIRIFVALVISINSMCTHATEFNTDVLDAVDVENIDISQFSNVGYIMPGEYELSIIKNGQSLGEQQKIKVIPNIDIFQQPFHAICLPKNILELLDLKDSSKKLVNYYDSNQCIDLSNLTGSQMNIDLSSLSLKLTIPQYWLEYQDSYWVPPAHWEEGINGAFIDYSANVLATEYANNDKQIYLSTNGTAGINLGAWRFRGDYSATYQRNKEKNSQYENRTFDFNRLYAFISLKKLASLLSVGENYFYSDIFESWQYSGISLESDDRMLPPKLVGYAPEITGVANTNATVTVRNKDRILLETTVPPGPFRIQTLDSGVKGVLDVTIREEDGEERQFSLNTASLPYLTRPGRLVYKLVMGKTRYDNHRVTGSPVIGGEFSYGLNNAWSLYGGSQLNKNYKSFAIGIGRDLFKFGALSLDITQSISRLSDWKIQGRSYRLNYAKSFDDIRTDITFAGYRFTDRNYRTLSQFMDEKRTGYTGLSPKENYQVYLNKYFDKFSISLNYQYSTYWRDNNQSQYGVYASTNINLPWLSTHDVNLSLSATRTERGTGYQDDAINLYLSIPLHNNQSISYSENYSRSGGYNQYSHNIGYNRYGDTDNYNISLGYNNGNNLNSQSSISGYYSKNLSQADMTVNASYVPHLYRSFGGFMNSGMTITSHGVALHRSSNGDTRIMIETPGVSGVPLDNGIISTNFMGLAVIPTVSSYRKTTTTINTSKLPDNLDTLGASTDITLTKGAIGYRKLEVMKGEKLFVVIKLNNGKTPPFGASVRNEQNRELGIIGEDGVTWIVGVSPQEKLSVYWNGEKQCYLELPNTLDPTANMLLLPCTLTY